MEILQVINEVANLLIFINATLFYIFIFGRKVSKIEKLPLIERVLLRIGLALPSVIGLWNVLYVSYPPNTEIIMNVGYSCLFTWASIFHYNQFVKVDRKK